MGNSHSFCSLGLLNRFSSVQSLDRLGRRVDMRDDSAEIFLKSFPQQAIMQGCPLFDFVHPAFLLPTVASTTLLGAPKDGFGEAVVACDMPTVSVS